MNEKPLFDLSDIVAATSKEVPDCPECGEPMTVLVTDLYLVFGTAYCFSCGDGQPFPWSLKERKELDHA